MSPVLPERGPLLDRDNPWPGLASYDEEAQHFFKGRGNDTTELLRRVKDAPVTLLFGKSGLGKSSLLRAGLFPVLRQERFFPIYLRLDVQDTSTPMIEQLARALTEECDRQRVDAIVRAAGETLWAYLHRIDFELWTDRNQLLTPVLVLDQFEEIFTIGAANLAAMERFRIDLGDLAENRIPAALKRSLEASSEGEGKLDLKAMRCRFLISLREDFLPDLEGWRAAMPSLIRNRMRLLPLNQEQAYTVVRDSAPHLVSELVARHIVRFVAGTPLPDPAAAGEPEAQTGAGEIEPALLSLVCQGLNEQRKREGKDKIDESMLAAGVQQTIISDYYRDCVASLPDAAQLFIEEELITEQGFRNSYSVADAIAGGVLGPEQIARLVDRRLLRIEEWRGAPRIELTHDLLTHAVRQHRDQRRAEAAERESSERLQAAQRELEVRSRQQKRRFVFVGALAALFLGLAVFEFLQWKQAAQAEAQAKRALAEALAGKLALQSSALLGERGIETGDLLALAAARTSLSSDARGMLQLALQSTAQLRWSLPAAERSRCVAFSPDGRALASADADGSVRLWDIARHQPLGAPLRGHQGESTAVTFSPDGKTLASAGADGTLRLWNLERQQLVGEPLGGHEGSVYAAAFSPDGKTLASAGLDGSVRLWDVARHQPLGEPLLGHRGSTRSVAFSPDGKILASAGTEGDVRLWDFNHHQAIGAPLRGHEGWVLSVAFRPDGKILASAGDDGTVRLWDLALRETVGQPLRGHQESVRSIVFSPDGKILASAGKDATVRLWDVARRETVGEPLRGHSGEVLSVAFSPEGTTLASAGEQDTVRLWDAVRRDPLAESLRDHEGWVLSVVFSPDRKTLASAGDDGLVRVWDSVRRQPLGAPLRGHEGWISRLAFSPDGKILASAGQDGTVRLWETIGYQAVGEPLRGHDGWASTVDFSPEGKMLASGGQDGTVRLWNLEGRPIGAPWQGHQSEISSLAFSRDGTTLVSGGYDGTLRLWNVAARQPQGEPLKGHSGRVLSVAFSPDGKILASAGQDGTVRLWDAARREPIGAPLRGHLTRVLDVAFSPNGKILASGGQDGSVRLWEVARRQLLGEPLSGHRDEVSSVSFAPDGATLASASYDGTLRLWDVDPESWMRKLCARLSRNLSRQEWTRYAGDIPYRPQCAELPIPEQ